jgi:hypothetical protein
MADKGLLLKKGKRLFFVDGFINCINKLSAPYSHSPAIGFSQLNPLHYH